MTVAVFFGCTFIAFGPAVALFMFTIARDPLRVIFLIAGAFFWLVSLLLSSLVWFITVQISNKNSAAQQRGLLIFGVVLSVLLQEAFRYGYYRLLKKANEGLLALSQEDTMPISMRQLAYGKHPSHASSSSPINEKGLAGCADPIFISGIGSDSAIFLGSGIGRRGPIQIRDFILFFQLCELFYRFFIFVLVLFSTQTFVNPHYQGSLVPTYIILSVMAAWAYLCAGGSLRNLKLCLTCKDKDFLLANHRPR
uniref:Gamma-secretase subunit APH-1 n=1 Tax=Sinocyclocheilus anshuiensis TaxID=1608454 RepID=A0A671NGD3_9TELE